MFKPLSHPLALVIAGYGVEKVLNCIEKPSYKLPLKTERVCRFCGKKSGEVTFDKAHIFPKSLGNNHFLSGFECDACNNKFSKYETNLSNFLGITKTIIDNNVLDKKKEFENKGTKLFQENLFGIHDALKFEFCQSDAIYTNDTISFIAKYTCNGYIPLYVFKAFMKMALSMIESNEVADYSAAIKFITKDTFDDIMPTCYRVVQHNLPEYISAPIGILFRKIDSYENSPTHIFILLYANYMFQIMIPFNEKDMVFQEIKMPICIPTTVFTQTEIDLSGLASMKEDHRNFEISFNRNDYKNSEILNFSIGSIKTGTMNPTSVAGFYVVNGNFNFTSSDIFTSHEPR